MKKLFLVLIVLSISTIVAGQAVDRGKLTKSGLWLQNALLHDGQNNDATHPNENVTPWVYLWYKGAGVPVTIRYYTSYISDAPGEHHQRIVIMNPKGVVVAEATRGFRTEVISAKFPQVFMGTLDEVIDIPAQNVAEPQRFGVWNIKIYADDTLLAEYPFPVVARE